MAGQFFETSRWEQTMDWDKLRVFHAAVEAGSFTHAADTLDRSQSAISRQISALEADLHVVLFHRHARGLVLTEQGELLNRTARDVFAIMARAEARLIEGRDSSRGPPLRISTTVARRLLVGPAPQGIPRAILRRGVRAVARWRRGGFEHARSGYRHPHVAAATARPRAAPPDDGSIPRLRRAGISEDMGAL
jgi:Bacterial regulatory helix-turn-helix protein, lysR family